MTDANIDVSTMPEWLSMVEERQKAVEADAEILEAKVADLMSRVKNLEEELEKREDYDREQQEGNNR